MQIGMLAKKSGLSVRAIRYYEELGLIIPRGHSSGGFRLYGEDSLRRLEIISFLKQLDLTLTEIRLIFDARKGSGGGRQAVIHLQDVFAGKLKLVDSKLEFLHKMRSDISRVLDILQSCRSCGHRVLLDSDECGRCNSLRSKGDIPELFNIILQKRSAPPTKDAGA